MHNLILLDKEKLEAALYQHFECDILDPEKDVGEYVNKINEIMKVVESCDELIIHKQRRLEAIKQGIKYHEQIADNLYIME